MAKIDYEQAVQTLQRVVGSRYEGVEADGRDTMTETLQRELGYSSHQADEVIDAMIAAGTLRYTRGTDGTDADADAGVLPVVPGTAVAGGGGTGSIGAAPIAPLAVGAGHWQIGADDSETSGRAGQVTPS